LDNAFNQDIDIYAAGPRQSESCATGPRESPCLDNAFNYGIKPNQHTSVPRKSQCFHGNHIQADEVEIFHVEEVVNAMAR